MEVQEYPGAFSTLLSKSYAHSTPQACGHNYRPVFSLLLALIKAGLPCDYNKYFLSQHW